MKPAAPNALRSPDACPRDAEALATLAAIRLRNADERTALALAAGLAAFAAFSTHLALLWLGVQLAVWPIDKAVWRRVAAQGRLPPALTVHVAVAAAAYAALALILWRSSTPHGDYIAALFLAAAILNSLVTLRAAPRLAWAAVTGGGAMAVLGPLAGGVLATGDWAAPLIGAAFLALFAGTMARTLSALGRQDSDMRAAAEQALKAAEAATRSKAAFVVTLGRELRTPMTALLGSAELLRKADLAPAHREHVDCLLESGEALLSVLNDVLDIGRIESGQVRLVCTPSSPAALARSVVQAWRARADDKWLELFLDVAPSTPAALSLDPLRLKQVLHTLIANAVEASRHGGVRVRLSGAEAASGRAKLVVDVIDSGAGYASEDLERAFSGLEIQRAHGPAGGIDLGLARARALARAMGGDITATSQKGQGATFRLVVDAPIASDEELTAPRLSAGPDGSGLCILLADDHAVSRRVIGMLLEQSGAEVTAVADGESALQALAKRRFDCVFLDLQMPDVGGLEVTRRVRSGGGPNQDTPIVALTAATMAEDKRRCAAAGMDAHLSKPIDPAALAGVLGRLSRPRMAA